MFLTVGNTGKAGEVPVLVVAAIEYALRHGWASCEMPNTTLTRSGPWIVLGVPLITWSMIFFRSLANSLERRNYVASAAPA